ncbi:MAG: hypothetical protein QNK36_15155 [Colwellia sp.]|nr:hypothetical protein [Colwellia sp.]
MINEYSEKPYKTEALLIELSNIKDAVVWLRFRDIPHQKFVSYILFGEPGKQVVVNVGEYLVRGLGGNFRVMSADQFERCYLKIEKPVKVKSKKI